MKKILSLLLIVSLFLVSLPLGMSAAEEKEFVLGLNAQVAEDGSTVTVEVYLENNPGVLGLDFSIGYNSDVFTLASRPAYHASFYGTMYGQTLKANPYSFVWISGDYYNVYGDMIAYTLTFKVRENVGAFAETFQLNLDGIERNCGTQEDEDGLTTEIPPVTVKNASVFYAGGTAASQEGDFQTSDNGDGTVTVTGYTGVGGDIVIPSQIGGKAVTAIGAGVYAGEASSITVPSSVETVAAGAFKGATCPEYTVLNPFCQIGAEAMGYGESGAQSGILFRGYGNLEAYVGETAGFTFLQNNAIVAADYVQLAINGTGFRIVGTVGGTADLAKVGFNILWESGDKSARKNGECSMVYESITNYNGETLTADSADATYDLFYVAAVRGNFANGDSFTITPYAVATDGSVYYGSTATYIYNK